MSLKEKFQITLPGKETGNEPWASFESARDTHGEAPYNNKTAFQEPDGKFNETPPGMDIDNQCKFQPKMQWFLDGDNDVTKNDKDFLKKGYSRAKMSGTDDQYTGEHIDLFYGEAHGDDGEVGFVERNNYLDRE
jgi:hypothetical protein